MREFIKTNDESLVAELKRLGFNPFNHQNGTWLFAKKDKLLAVLNEKFSGKQFFVDNKLFF